MHRMSLTAFLVLLVTNSQWPADLVNANGRGTKERTQMNKSAGWQPSTLSRQVSPSAASGGSPYLFLVFQCDRPHSPGARLCLDQVESVEIGRSSDPSAARVDELGVGRLALRVPDSWMSSSH